jgi:hypothetical protein
MEFEIDDAGPLLATRIMDAPVDPHKDPIVDPVELPQRAG